MTSKVIPQCSRTHSRSCWSPNSCVSLSGITSEADFLSCLSTRLAFVPPPLPADLWFSKYRMPQFFPRQERNMYVAPNSLLQKFRCVFLRGSMQLVDFDQAGLLVCCLALTTGTARKFAAGFFANVGADLFYVTRVIQSWCYFLQAAKRLFSFGLHLSWQNSQIDR